MDTDAGDRILQFGPGGMRWEVTGTTAETGGASFDAINVIPPHFGGPPLHVHPAASETYAVVAGELDVCVGGRWRTVRPGESVTVPPGVPHTVKNSSGGETRILNTHAPAMAFERFFRRMHAMIAAGKLSLPPRGPAQVVRLCMLFEEHPREIVSIKPPRLVTRALALLGRAIGLKLPA